MKIQVFTSLNDRIQPNFYKHGMSYLSKKFRSRPNHVVVELYSSYSYNFYNTKVIKISEDNLLILCLFIPRISFLLCLRLMLKRQFKEKCL